MKGRNPTPWTAPCTVTLRRSKFIASSDLGGNPAVRPRRSWRRAGDARRTVLLGSVSIGEAGTLRLHRPSIFLSIVISPNSEQDQLRREPGHHFSASPPPPPSRPGSEAEMDRDGCSD